MTPDELWFRYADGERDFRGIELIQAENNLRGNPIELRGFDLREINLRGAYLRLADFSETDLTGADLSGAFLVEATLKRTIIRNANLQSVNLHWSSLHEADLRGANLDHMNASSAFFCGAKIDTFQYAVLAYANFQNATIPKQLICRCGNLIWRTTMSDGTIVVGPQYGDGEGR
ncbi:pentapeptide repeat-containing protein [Aphanothece hegewaldii]|nr:pentapeptide repeat-containing protein [Aphanothece hegewaldii]